MENNIKQNSKIKEFFILGAFIALGLALLGYIAGSNFIKAKKLDRIVTVKGLSEKNFKADQAFWPITIKGVGDNLQMVNSKLEGDREKVTNYLIKAGFAKEEIELGKYNVIDLMAREYRSKEDENFRYIITATVNLTTSNVDLVKEIFPKITELAKENVIIENVNSSYNSFRGPRYEFTKLNDIKVEMLAEANNSARKSAEQFARDSNSKLGAIKKATQGNFSIELPFNSDVINTYESEARSHIIKKIRVITTIDYYLVD